jgi:hypothetical protein
MSGVVRIWAVRKVHDDSQPLDAAAMADWKELECPCGGLVRLGSHAGEHAVAHAQPACKHFMESTPVEFGQWMAAHWFGLIKGAGRHQ